jgi:hypothetical protein
VIEKGRVYIEATRTIQQGQELGYDYEIGREPDDPPNVDEIFACRCGTAKCRGTMLPRRRSARPRTATAAQRPVADEQRHAGAARRVHRGVGDRNADQVDQRQAQADGDRREARRGARLSVAPRMTSRKNIVITTSVTSAAVSE